jgi:hypothetical protein
LWYCTGMVRFAALVLVSLAGVAGAQPKSTVVGATEVQKITAPSGFIDDAVTFDDKRLAYVIADGSTKAELHVVEANQPEIVVDVSALTVHPVALRFVGQRMFVVGEDGSTQVAGLVELAAASKKPVVYKLGPADHITVITRDGKPRVAVHHAQTTKAGERHELELVAIETGKAIQKAAIDVDTHNKSSELDLVINHWSDGMTRAYGLKGGVWDKKENQRSPDVEATYDLLTAKFVDRQPIADLFEQRKRFQVLADAKGELDFVRMAWDNQSVQLWRGGKPKPLTLDQPLSTYDPKSLQGVLEADGTTWIALEVDPVNPDAVARKKADPVYIDIFRAGPDGKAERKMRVLAATQTAGSPTTKASGAVRFRFGTVRGQVWLLEGSPGFDRGGRSLALYKLAT